MLQLAQTIPDVDVMLALAPEELAAKLLFFIRQRITANAFESNGMVSRQNSEVELHRVESYRARWPEVNLAFAEAWAWLQAQGLLVPAEGTSGSNGWCVLSRRAKTFETEADVAPYAYVRRFPKEALHPRFADKVWAAFMRGEFDIAVFQSMKAVEVAVRAAYGKPALGVDLMRLAFSPDKGPLSDMKVGHSERRARMELFAGAFGAYRNPHAHRDVPLDNPAEAIEIILLANHLLRIVESRCVAKGQA